MWRGDIGHIRQNSERYTELRVRNCVCLSTWISEKTIKLHVCSPISIFKTSLKIHINTYIDLFSTSQSHRTSEYDLTRGHIDHLV